MEMNSATRPILVVDDETIVRESIRDWLREAGYPAELAGNGEQALEMIAKKDFSILILDYRLPGKSGMDVLREAKVTRPQIKSIIITAFPSANLRAELRELGALDDLLIKPVMTEDLEKLVRKKLVELEAEEPRQQIDMR
jgi:DNA-binding NtrC family response regulator